MAESIVPRVEVAGAKTSTSVEGEMKVIIRCDLSFAEYVGTRAQLEAEGVIPAGTKLPEGGDDARWQSGALKFWLRRTRPEGMKGPMKLWLVGDWWFLRMTLVNQPDHAARCIARKARELHDEIYRHTPAARRLCNANHQKFWDAQGDARYQAFKAMIPGLVPPKRGRRSKASPPAA